MRVKWYNAVSPFRVAMNLCFKVRLSAKSYANKTYFHKKGSH